MRSGVAICAGTFDPVTNGHVDIIDRATKLFETVVIGVAKNPAKCPLFSLDERIRFVVDATNGREGVRVEAFDELLVDFAKRNNSHVIIKGLRAISDFEREFQMAQFTRRLDPEVETLFMMATPEYMFLSSSAVKEIASYGGSVRGLVSNAVEAALISKYHRGLEGGS